MDEEKIWSILEDFTPHPKFSSPKIKYHHRITEAIVTTCFDM